MLTKEQETVLERYSLDRDGASIGVIENPDRTAYFCCGSKNILIDENGKQVKR